jgi:hypothetical protein
MIDDGIEVSGPRKRDRIKWWLALFKTLLSVVHSRLKRVSAHNVEFLEFFLGVNGLVLMDS